MIKIGLTGWGDHPSLYSPHLSKKNRLFDYSGHFPIVELDTSFYAIPSVQNVEKWVNETPEQFQFIVKAYQGITGHLRDENPYPSELEMYENFRNCLNVFQKSGKLALVLVQFPPWFHCTKKNFEQILYISKQLKGFPIAIEFRNNTWYSSHNQKETIDFLRKYGFIHTICDEPQAGIGSVPFVAEVTSKKALVRIHGRNVYGWNASNSPNWREVRFLYDYNNEELTQLAERIILIEKQCDEVYVLFNNNSGHHAAKNAKTLQRILNIEYDGLSPKQLDLFEGEF